MKQLLKFFLFLASLSLMLAACSPAAAPTPQAITLTDGLNRTVTLEHPAQKIVSGAPSNTEILFAIGAGGQTIGRDEFSDFPAQAKTLPNVGGPDGKLNLEAISKLQPDLVLLASINTPEQVKALENLGIKVFYLANPNDFNGLYDNLKTVGVLTGHEKEATSLSGSLQQRIGAIEKKVAAVSAKPNVFYELDGSDPSKPWTTGPQTYMDQLLALAGGQNAAHGLSSQWAQISQEELLVQNPDIILLGDGAYGTTIDQVAKRTGWDVMKAVKDGKIFTLDDNLISRPGPRMVDGLETIVKIIHPELFK
jgi:iron complex transport system substrate-binding protein